MSQRPARPTAPAEPQVEPKRKNRTSWLLLLIIIACVVLYLAARGGGGSTSQSKTHNALGAWAVTENFVEDRLVSPSTAEFPCCYDDFTRHLGGGRYEVAAYVDSQNRLGAMIRTDFVAVVSWQGDDKWKLESIAFDEQ